MKKAIAVMAGLSMMMPLTSAVYADFGFATEPDEVAVYVQAYIDEKIPGKAVVEITDSEVIVRFNKTSFLNPTQQGNILMENLRSYLISNDADYSIVRAVYDETVTGEEKITDLQKISGLVKIYIDKNHQGDAVTIETTEEGKVSVVFITAASDAESEKNISGNIIKYLDENGADTSLVEIKFKTEAPAETTSAIGDIDGSGTIDVTDLTELSLALLGDRVLNEAQQKAADVDGDGTLSLADLAKLRQYLSKKIDSLA